MRDRSAAGAPECCPYCGDPLPITVTITKATVDAEVVVMCANPDCFARWAEHYDGEILRMPTVRLDDA